MEAQVCSLSISNLSTKQNGLTSSPWRQIYCRGVLLKTNYERESIFKLFTRRVCSSMDAARRTGDIGVPPLQMARSTLSWRVPPVAQARHADVHWSRQFLLWDTPILKCWKHAANLIGGTCQCRIYIFAIFVCLQ